MRRFLPVLLLLCACKEKTYFSPFNGASRDVEALVYQGDRIYAQAMRRLETGAKLSGPERIDALHEATQLFTKAEKDHYVPAASTYAPSPFPLELRERLEKTTIGKQACRALMVPGR